jgi:hypothetical protein
VSYPPPPDPTRGFPVPPPYDPNQAPPVIGGPPVQPYAPGPYPQPGQPYGFPPPGPYPQPVPPKQGWSAGKTIAVVAAAFLGVCLIGALGTALGGNNTKPAAGPVATQPPTPAKGEAAVTEEPTDEPPTEEPAEENEPADDAGKFNLKPGTTLTWTDGDEVQNATLVSAKSRKGACNTFGGKPKNGLYLIVEVRVEQKKGVGSVNPLYFEFVGADGTTSSSIDGAFSGCAKNSLDSTNSLRAGTKRAGQLVFDVKSAKGTVELTPGLISDTVGSWKVG